MLLESPGKINLGLEIHHRRPEDGYHYLASLFFPFYPGDRLEIEPADRMEMTTRNLLSGESRDEFEKVSERGDPTKNLVWKALIWIQETTGQSYRIHLEKRLPAGAGLGGGSSNAGTLLRFAGEQEKIPGEHLLRGATSLGADVPFFLNPVPSLVTGIGEILHPIQAGDLHGVLCLSGIHVNTRLTYNKLKRALQHAPPPGSLSSLTDEVVLALRESRWEDATALQNDFETVVLGDHPLLGKVKKAFLETGAPYASLTGSGSGLFGLSRTEDGAQRLLAAMQLRFPELVFRTFQSRLPRREG